ncbi:MAG: hypothetical protein RSG53_08930 [Oscillospiraceae bacterium]
MNFLIDGILPVACVFGAFALVYIANIFFGISVNCIAGLEVFEWRRLLRSVLRILLTAFTMFIIVVAFNLIAFGLRQYDVAIKEGITSIISVGVFILLFAKGFAATAVDVYEKIRALYEIKDNTTFDLEALANMAITRPTDEFNEDTVEHEAQGVG